MTFQSFNWGLLARKPQQILWGFKGCGEAGSIAAPPTIMNAVFNALDGQEISMPATAEKVWKACKELKKSNAKAA
ncbi:MAG: hypothetical protein CM1200mP5_4030 [Candidatus Pelagibacterales bacterium]|nr:MAG: hypothetical protein CM1200mP5_4030 [Pelagibacterales bacterium]